MGRTARTRGTRLLVAAAAASALAAGAAAGYALLSPATSVPPGRFSGHPRCADVLSALPGTLAGRPREDTDGAGTASWGDAAVVLRCGVEPLPATPDQCVSVDGVDWVVDEDTMEGDDLRLLTTYGRLPAVEVTVSGAPYRSGEVLVDVNRAVEGLPRDGRCVALGDTP